MTNRTMTDDELIDMLREIDDSEAVTVTSREADFIESVVFKRKPGLPLTKAQRELANDIIRKYEDEL